MITIINLMFCLLGVFAAGFFWGVDGALGALLGSFFVFISIEDKIKTNNRRYKQNGD